jgi:hypothetical protein
VVPDWFLVFQVLLFSTLVVAVEVELLVAITLFPEVVLVQEVVVQFILDLVEVLL